MPRRLRPPAAIALTLGAVAVLVVWVRRKTEVQVENLAGAPAAEVSLAQPAQNAPGAPAAEATRHFPEELGRLQRETPGQLEAARTLIREWIAADPDTAWRWALRQGETFDDSGVFSPLALIAQQMISLDLERAIALVGRDIAARNSSDGRRGAQAVVDAIIRTGQDERARDAIENWLAVGGAGALGSAPLDAGAAALAKRSPLDAAMWLESLPASAERDTALGALATLWAGSAPGDALTWAKTLPDSAARDAVLLRGFSRWLEHDLAGATTWFAANDGDPAADRMIVNVLRDTGFAALVPGTAFRWAELIADPALRQEQMQDVASAWAFRDYDSARRYIAEHTKLSAAEKTQLLGIVAVRRKSP